MQEVSGSSRMFFVGRVEILVKRGKEGLLEWGLAACG
jgi:hypothetical protein